MKPTKIKGWSGAHSPISSAELRKGLNKYGKKTHKIKNPL